MALTPDLERLKQNATKFAQGFTPGQKAVTAVAIVALVIGSFFFITWASQPSYSVLFTNLQPADAAAITSKLQAQKVPYQLAQQGQAIMVPSSQVYQLRLNMAQAGLPANGNAGFSLLNNQGLTTSQFTQQIDYQRALEGELAKTIESIQGVNSARVSLVLPPNNVFSLSNNAKARASVMVGLQPGQTLTSQQVQAIVHLVSSSVPNLSASDVTVVNSQGQVLAAPGVNLTTNAHNQQMSTYDISLETSIQNMLDKVLGVGHSVVTVHARLNYNKVKTSTQQIQLTPKGTPVTVPVSTSKITETYSGTGAPGGILGGGVGAVNGAGKYSKVSSSTQYAVGKISQTTQNATGTVGRLSVAVVIDSRVKNISLAQIRQLVIAAAGIVPKRGDTLAVAKIPFSTVATKQAQAALAQAAKQRQAQQLDNLIKTVGLLVLVLGTVLLLLWSARRASNRNEDMYEDSILELEHEPSLGELPTTQVSAVPSNQPSRESLNGELSSFIDDQPDEVARLLRTWMAERQGSNK